MIIQHNLLRSEDLQLNRIIHLDVVQKVVDIIREDRKVGPGRIYVICALFKKICVFLSCLLTSKSGTVVLPQSIPAYCFIESLRSESTIQRKNLLRDQAVLELTISRDCRTKTKSC